MNAVDHKEEQYRKQAYYSVATCLIQHAWEFRCMFDDIIKTWMATPGHRSSELIEQWDKGFDQFPFNEAILRLSLPPSTILVALRDLVQLHSWFHASKTSAWFSRIMQEQLRYTLQERIEAYEKTKETTFYEA